MKIICPEYPHHSEFVTTAHEVHEWVVDQSGEFLMDRGCLEVSHKPLCGNLFTTVSGKAYELQS